MVTQPYVTSNWMMDCIHVRLSPPLHVCTSSTCQYRVMDYAIIKYRSIMCSYYITLAPYYGALHMSSAHQYRTWVKLMITQPYVTSTLMMDCIHVALSPLHACTSSTCHYRVLYYAIIPRLFHIV